MNTKHQLLRRAFLGNATFSTLTGASMLLAPTQLANLLGQPVAAMVMPWVGTGLLVFAGVLVAQATRPQMSPHQALATVGADLAWVFGTGLAGLVWPAVFSPTGWAIAATIACVVSLFAGLQLLGYRRLAGEMGAA